METSAPAKTRPPVVAIVGRPNVGKSTLFNRLIGKRAAIVEDTPGVTRDRLYHEAEWQDKAYGVIDTGGILFGEDDPLIEQVRVQAEIAISEADLILFLVDGKEGIHPADLEVADMLRKGRKPVLLLVNKADAPDRWAMVAADFHAMGLGSPMPVSSMHGHGVAEVLDAIFERAPEVPFEEDLSDNLPIAIVGRPNVGKSSLLNAVLGEARAIVSEIPGTTRDAIDTAFEWKGQSLTLIDTAGLKRPGKVQRTLEYYAQLRAERAIQRADAAVVVIDGQQGVTHGDKRVAQYAHDGGKAIVWAVNKWDLIEPPDGQPRKRSAVKQDFATMMREQSPSFAYAPICFVSALKRTGIGAMLDTAMEAADAAAFRIGTGELNTIIQEAIFERPLSRRGRILKVYYATMPAVRPPTIVLFVNDEELAHFSYIRYLENAIRRHYPYVGSQLKIIARPAHEKKG